MTGEDLPSAPRTPPREGDVLGAAWRLGRKVASGDAGDFFETEHVLTGARVAVWVLGQRAVQDTTLLEEIRNGVRRSAVDPDVPVRYHEIVTDAARGVIYAVMEVIEGDLRAVAARLEALLTARSSQAKARPAADQSTPETDAEADAMPLAWLQDRRVAAARAGAAPFARPLTTGAAFARGVESGSGATAAASPAPPPMPSDAEAGPPTRRRGANPALWGSAAAIGVLLVGSGTFLHGAMKTAAGGAADEASMSAGPPPVAQAPGAPGSPSPMPPPPPPAPTAPDARAGDPVRALAGAWALDGDCGRPTQLTVVEGRLIGRGAAGPIEIGSIQRVEPDGGVVVGAPGGGSTTYRVRGETLTATSGERPPLHYTRCPPADAAGPANVSGEAALIAMAIAGAGAAPPEPSPPPVRDEVDVSAFAPKQVRAGDVALVQIYLHLIDQAEMVAERARAADAEAAPRGQTTLGLGLARGARVDIMLDAGGLDLDETVQPVVWRGRPCAAQFAVAAPADAKLGQRVLTARALVEGVPLGRLSFTLTVAPAEAAVAAHAELAGDFAKRYGRAFLSYSSLDRPEVLKTAQTLRATGIDYFQDILSIEPGEAWRERLFAEIDRCDLFLLFWSSHAAGSAWVREEAERALARRHGSAGASIGASPDIRPIILEGPPIPLPPPSLAELHFNDMLRYVVVASELEARARKL